MKNILALVFVTAAIAPPPFAAPSSFVIIIPPIELTSVNAFDCASDCCPIVESITNNV